MPITKKGQFGPDALIGIVLVAVLGLGGVFFLNTFVNGLALHGILSVLDSEIDQRCFYMLLPLVGDEYSRAGTDVSATPPFNSMVNYFGGSNDYSYVSYEFNNTINIFKSAVGTIPFLVDFTNIDGHIAYGAKAAELTAKISNEHGGSITNYCSLPVYSPAGKVATAELFIGEKS